MALARARELTDSVMAAINNGTDPDSHVQIFPYSGSHSFPVFGFRSGVPLHPDRGNIWPGCNTKTALVNKHI